VNLRSIVAQERSKCNLNPKKARLDAVARVWDHAIFECGRLVGKNVGGRNPAEHQPPTYTPCQIFGLLRCDDDTSHSNYIFGILPIARSFCSRDGTLVSCQSRLNRDSSRTHHLLAALSNNASRNLQATNSGLFNVVCDCAQAS